MMLVLVRPESVVSSCVGSSCSGRAYDLQVQRASVSRVRLLRPFEAKRIQCLAGIGRKSAENGRVKAASRKLSGDLSSARQATQSRRALRYLNVYRFRQTGKLSSDGKKCRRVQFGPSWSGGGCSARENLRNGRAGLVPFDTFFIRPKELFGTRFGDDLPPVSLPLPQQFQSILV